MSLQALLRSVGMPSSVPSGQDQDQAGVGPGPEQAEAAPQAVEPDVKHQLRP